jgi:prevent-host-death family protein
MKTVGSRELKNRLGRYLGMVGKGETIIVTTHGKPVARLLPPEPVVDKPNSAEDFLRRLEADGHLHRGTRPFKRFKLIRVKGKPMSQMIIEDRT